MIKTIDAHVTGQSLRLIVEGLPSLRGLTMADKQAWAITHADRVRQLMLLGPRGERDLTGAVLTEPILPGSHAGVLFMRADGYVPMSAHGIIAAVTIALERGLIDPGGDGRHLTLDTVAGTIRAEAHWDRDDDSGRHVEHVTMVNVPSFVMRPGVEVVVESRRIRADVAFGGRFYAIVDSESVGLSLDTSHLPELRRAGKAIANSVQESGVCVHPAQAHVAGVHGTVFTGPPHGAGADLRSVTVLTDGSIDRSASGTGLSGVMAVLSAMGFLPDAVFVGESLFNEQLRGRVSARTMVGDVDAIVPAIDGAAWITGDHVFHAARGDARIYGLEGD